MLTVPGAPPAQTAFTIDHAAHRISFARHLKARPSQVFDAWTKPERIAQWWDPSGHPLAVCEIDLRPQGAFKFVPRGRPDMPFTGIYLEIVANERLVFDVTGAIGRVLFAEADRGTALTVQIQCRSAEHLQQYLRLGIHEGTARTLDNLVGYVAATP